MRKLFESFRTLVCSAALIAGHAHAHALAAPLTVDSALPAYAAAPGVSGTVKSTGSDTMVNLMTHWGESFKRVYPNVKIEVEGKGSSTAPPALIEGQVQFGPMSRAMKASEVDKFEARFGYKPTGLRVAIDALAIFVHKDAPIDTLSLDQVRAIFSVDGKDMTWGDLGVADPAWASKTISLYGRNSASGTYGFFKEFALDNKDFKATVKEQPGSSAVVQAVATDRFAMGYSGIGYKTADVKAVRLRGAEGDEPVEATPDACYDGTYPLARFLYLYVNAKPGEALDPLRAEFVKMVLSREGQEAVIQDRYVPVTAETAREELKRVGLNPQF